jgi:uncharacterized protein
MRSTARPSWTPTADRLRTAVERFVAAAQPKRIMLFGLRACGDADDRSDDDLLVVEQVVADRYEETIRLNRAVKGLVMTVDLLVVSEEEFEQRSVTPGTSSCRSRALRPDRVARGNCVSAAARRAADDHLTLHRDERRLSTRAVAWRPHRGQRRERRAVDGSCGHTESPRGPA